MLNQFYPEKRYILAYLSIFHKNIIIENLKFRIKVIKAIAILNLLNQLSILKEKK